MEIKKAVILIAGLGTRFLPLSKVVPKEFWPLVDKPVLEYIVEEAFLSGIKKIVFVNQPKKKWVWDYFQRYLKPKPLLKKILKVRGKNHLLEELKRLERISRKISFSQVIQKKPLGNGHAILNTEKIIDKEPFAVLFGDDIVESKTPCLKQLIKVFKKYQAPVLSLYQISKEKIPFYGIVSVKKIKSSLYQVEDILEKPEIEKAPSNLAIVGKYILTPDIFNYLKREKTDLAKEIILSDALRKMIKDGKKILGLKFEGRWLECGNKLAYLKSNLYLYLKHPQWGKELKEFIEKERLI